MKVYDPQALGLHVVRTGGVEAYCNCPFHHDHTPSASFNMEKGLFHCFGCGESMGARKLAHELGGQIVFTEIAALSITSIKTRDEWEWMMYLPLATENGYLTGRHVSRELVERYQIRELKDGSVAFPLTNEKGVICGFQVRRAHKLDRPKYLFYGEKGPLWPLQDLLDAKKDETIFVTEGAFGVLRGAAGGRRVVTSMGSQSIKRMLTLLNGRSKIVVFDEDFAGKLGAAKLVATGDFSAIMPGTEADELPIESWQNIENEFEMTRNFYDIAMTTEDPHRVIKLAQKFVKSLSI